MTSRKAWIAGLLGVAAFASTPRAGAQVVPPIGGAASPAAVARGPVGGGCSSCRGGGGTTDQPVGFPGLVEGESYGVQGQGLRQARSASY